MATLSSSQEQRSPSQSQSQPRQIIIQPYPFNSAVGQALVHALDTELTDMYPEFDDPNHPLRERVLNSHDPTYERNPKPSSVDDAVNGTNASATTQNPHLPMKVLNPHDDLTNDEAGANTVKDLPKDQTAKMHFHIAFDVTGIERARVEQHLNSGPDISDNTHFIGEPVGCVAVKLLPLFPYHQEHQLAAAVASAASSPSSSSKSSTTTTGISPLRHAEIKRMYIVPSSRGLLVQRFSERSLVKEGEDDNSNSNSNSNSNNTDGDRRRPTRLATVLMEVASTYAKTVLHVDRLVLETGWRQVAAIKLYERLGYRRRDVYGDYVGFGQEDGGVSMCYEVEI